MPEDDQPTTTPPAGTGARGLFRRDMERQEQLISFAGAGLAVVLGLVLAFGTKPQVKGAHATHPASTAFILGASCGLAVVLWLAARHGSRVLTALVSMALFLTAFGGTLLGFPFVALGGWLLIRNSRSMREQRLATRGQSAGAGAGRGSREPRPPRQGREPRLSRRAQREEAAAEARRIEANKRYTPPVTRRNRRGR